MLNDKHPVDYKVESTANLSAGGTFIGTYWDMGYSPTVYDQFQAVFNSSHASATDGAKIQVSNDAINWITVALGTQVASTPLTLTITPCARYVRVSQTNGATAQTSNAVLVSVRKAV